jgi:hypothetical protein
MLEFLVENKLLQPFLLPFDYSQISYTQKTFKKIVHDLQAISLILTEDTTENYSLYDIKYMSIYKCLTVCATLKHLYIKFYGRHVGRYLLLYLISKLKYLETLSLIFDYCYIDICKCLHENFKWVHLKKFTLKINLGISSTKVREIVNNIMTYSKQIEYLDIDFLRQNDLSLFYLNNITNLRNLSLSFSNITNEGFHNISEIIRCNNNLSQLEISCILLCEPIKTNTYSNEIKILADSLKHLKQLHCFVLKIYSMTILKENIIYLFQSLILNCLQIDFVRVRGYRSDITLKSKQELLHWIHTLEVSFF